MLEYPYAREVNCFVARSNEPSSDDSGWERVDSLSLGVADGDSAEIDGLQGWVEFEEELRAACPYLCTDLARGWVSPKSTSVVGLVESALRVT